MNFQGSSGKKGGGGGTAPPSSSPSLSSNRSFKKSNNAQGGQSRVSGGIVSSDSNKASTACAGQNGAHSQPPLPGASNAPVTGLTVKPTDVPTQKNTRGVPKAPSSGVTPVSSETVWPLTPGKVQNSCVVNFLSGLSMQVPFHQPQVPVQFGSLNPQMQGQGLTNTSLPMPMPMQMQLPVPVPVGKPSQVRQQVFVPGLLPHPMQSQGIMHQGQNLNFASQMGPQLPQLGNLGISIGPQFQQQQAGKFARSHRVPPQSLPIPSYRPAHPIHYYPNPYNPSGVAQETIRVPVQITGVDDSRASDSKTDSTEEGRTRESSERVGAEITVDTSPVHERPKYETVGSKEQAENMMPEESKRDQNSCEINPVSAPLKSSESVNQTEQISDLEVTTSSNETGALETAQRKLDEPINVGNIVPSASTAGDALNAAKSSTSDASLSRCDGVGSKEVAAAGSPMLDQESPIVSIPSLSEATVGREGEGGTGSKDKLLLEPNKAKNTMASTKQKRKKLLQKARAAGTSFDLYMAYNKGPEEKKESVTSAERTESIICSKQVSAVVSREYVVSNEKSGQSKAELDDWEDAADISTPKLESPNNGKQSREGVKQGEDGNGVLAKKYSRDFLLKFSEHCIDLPEGFQITPDTAEAFIVSNVNISRDFPSPGRIMQRKTADSDRWQRATGFQKGLIPSPHTPLQVMHKAERKYEIGKVTDEEQAKQRQLKEGLKTNSQDTTETRTKAEWVPSHDAYLVELFIEHYGGGITQSGFKGKVYRKVTQAINKKFNMNLDVPQIKNRYNVLKEDFGIVKALLKVSGFGWDATKKIVVAGDREWDDYLAVHGDARAFRRKEFPLYDRLSIIFEGQRATGKYQVSNVQVASEEGHSNANTTQISKLTNPSTKEVSATQEGSSSSSDSIFQLDSEKPKQLKVDHDITSSCQKKKPRLETGDKIANAFFEMASASKIRAEQNVEANGLAMYQKCIEDLQKMEELNETEILKSLSVLRDEKNAIAFMTLKGLLRLAFLRSLW